VGLAKGYFQALHSSLFLLYFPRFFFSFMGLSESACFPLTMVLLPNTLAHLSFELVVLVLIAFSLSSSSHYHKVLVSPCSGGKHRAEVNSSVMGGLNNCGFWLLDMPFKPINSSATARCLGGIVVYRWGKGVFLIGGCGEVF